MELLTQLPENYWGSPRAARILLNRINLFYTFPEERCAQEVTLALTKASKIEFDLNKLKSGIRDGARLA